MNLSFEHPDPPHTQDPTVRIEDIWGYFPQITSAQTSGGVPNWTPNNFRSQIAIYADSGTYQLFVWDTANAAWRTITMS